MERAHATSIGRQFLHRWLRTGGARRKLLIFLVLVVGTIALLPQIIAKTPLRDVLISAAVPNDALRVTVRDVSLSWFHGPSWTGVEVRDPAGNMLFAADKLATDRGPLDLLRDRNNFGVIQIIRPAIYAQLRPDGSNLEDVVRKLTSGVIEPPVDSGDAPATQMPAFALQLVEGTIHVDDLAGNRRWRVDGVNAQYDSRGAASGVGQGSLSGQIVEVSQRGEVPAGRFSLSIQPADAGRQQLTLQAEALSLAIIEPALRRFVPQSELSGVLSGQGVAAWNSNAPISASLVTSGNLAIDQLDATAPALLGDRVRLARVELPWRLKSQADGLAIEDLQLRSEIGQAAVRGRLDPDWSAARHDVEMRGAIDVARLAAMLPHALRIRQGTTITSGSIELSGRYQPDGQDQQLTGSIRTSPLAATNAGRPLRWDEPVSANFALRRANNVIRLDSLRCDSKFLKIEATGGREQFNANASFDLNSLAEQLGQFVDLSGAQLAGTGTATLGWKQTATNQFSATAQGDLIQLVVSLRDGAAWSEPQLSLRGEAAGVLDPLTNRPARVDNATLNISAPSDALEARLLTAVGLANGEPVWPIAVRAQGGLARWLTRARPWFALDPWQIDGQSDVTATLRVARNIIEASDTKLVVTNLRATSSNWNIVEPRAELSGNARWNGATGEISADSAQLVTSTISIAARDARYSASAEGIGQLAGAAAFRADLARLATWRAGSDQASQYQPKGELTGNLRFAQQGDRITGDLTATGQNLILAAQRKSPAATPASRAVPGHDLETIWQEANLTVRALASYDKPADRLAFDQLQIQSNTLQATASGQIQNLSSTAETNLTGTLNYDLAQVTPLLRPYLSDGIQLAGREQARFALTGNLNDGIGPRAQLTGTTLADPYRTQATQASVTTTHWSRRVRAQFELPWSGATLYGLPVGAGRLSANVGDGALRIEPLSLAVGEGRLTAAPNVRFDPQPSELTLPAGPLLTNVRISPEVSEAMLKYFAPVLAGVTQSEGQFSMQLDSTRVPLAEPKRADTAGRLTVHSVRVVPGAFARELISVGQQVEALAKRRDPTALATRQPATLLAIRDQQVGFRVVEGRVHHQNMEFQVGDVTMRSQGSVGFDQSVQLTLHVPVQDAWIVKEPLLAGLKGQSLQVPVSGTLTRPQLDQRAVASLSTQLLQNAAGQAIGGELNKALDKLFKSR